MGGGSCRSDSRQIAALSPLLAGAGGVLRRTSIWILGSGSCGAGWLALNWSSIYVREEPLLSSDKKNY